MLLPDNVVRMPDEQRAELKWLAGEATKGPWKVAPSGHVYTGDGRAPLNVVWLLKDNCRYIAAVSPDVTLGTLAYVEAAEAHITKLEQQVADLKQELAEQEVEKLDQLNELAAYKLVHQGMQTKWHAILQQVMAPLPDFDEAVATGKAMQRAGYTPKTPLLNCQSGCEICQPKQPDHA